jgi:hypothetical protein
MSTLLLEQTNRHPHSLAGSARGVRWRIDPVGASIKSSPTVVRLFTPARFRDRWCREKIAKVTAPQAQMKFAAETCPLYTQ